MTQWIVSSSVLIALVLALRGLLRDRITPGIRYGLWSLVLVRLLIPGTYLEWEFSVGKLTQAALDQPVVVQASQDVRDYAETYDRLEAQNASASPAELTQAAKQDLYDRTYEALSQSYASAGQTVTTEALTQQATQRVETVTRTVTVTQWLGLIWVLGMALVAGGLVCSNVHFIWTLSRNRHRVEVPRVDLPVYRTDHVATPCLVGLFRPRIYLTREAWEDSRVRRHVLEHELSHYRQGDHIWSWLRCLCLVVHWYNPLVWVAAILSKKDAELACDEATVGALGEGERLEYGRTLIRMTCVRRDPGSLLLTATTMVGSGKHLAHRIRSIAFQPKNTLIALTALVLVAALAVGCTFTGAPAASDSVPAEAEALYLAYVEEAKADWPAAAEKYVHYKTQEYKAYVLENDGLEKIHSYELLKWEQVQADLWAVTGQSKAHEDDEWSVGTHFVGIVDGAWVVMLNRLHVPEALAQGVALEAYVTYGENFLGYEDPGQIPADTEPTDVSSQEPQILTDVELAEFNELFNSLEEEDLAWYNYALRSEYSLTRDVDLRALFGSTPGEELTQDDLDFLVMMGRDPEGLRKYSGQIMEDVLQTYLAVSLDSCRESNGDRVIYRASENCYYLQPESQGSISVTFTWGIREVDGSVMLYYTKAEADGTPVDMIAVLAPQGEAYVVKYNYRAPEPEPEPEETEPLDYPANDMANLLEWSWNGTNWRNYATRSVFADPSEIDLYELFRSVPSEELTESDRAFLRNLGEDPDGVWKYSVSSMNAVLYQYFGISYEDCNGVGLDQMIFRENPYNSNGECYFIRLADLPQDSPTELKVLAAEEVDGNTILVLYENAYLDPENPVLMLLTLELRGENYYYDQVVSNVPIQEYRKTGVLSGLEISYFAPIVEALTGEDFQIINGERLVSGLVLLYCTDPAQPEQQVTVTLMPTENGTWELQ